MKTRSQRKYLDGLLPEIVRVVLSCVRPSDALPLARCSKHWRDACLSDWSLWRLWYLADFGPCGISPKHVWRGRYRRAWALRIEPGKRACGLTLGEDFSAYSPRATLRTDGEAPYDKFPRRGRLTVRYAGEDEDLEYYLRDEDIVASMGEPDPDECDVGVGLSEGDGGHVDYVVAYDNSSTLFDPARPFVNRAHIRPGSTLRQLLAAFRLTVDAVECHGSNWHGPLCSLDDVDGLFFVVERAAFDVAENGRYEDVTESWLDFAIVSFDVLSSEEDSIVEEDQE